MARHALLNNVAHKDLRVITRPAPEFGDNVTSVLTFPTEYGDVQREYPIFFRKDAATGEFISVALLGLREERKPVPRRAGLECHVHPRRRRARAVPDRLSGTGRQPRAGDPHRIWTTRASARRKASRSSCRRAATRRYLERVIHHPRRPSSRHGRQQGDVRGFRVDGLDRAREDRDQIQRRRAVRPDGLLHDQRREARRARMATRCRS